LAIWFSQRKLKEQELLTSDEITEVITTIWNDVTFEELQSAFSEWIQRATWAIEHGGNVTINDYYSFVKEFSLVEKGKAVRTFWTTYNIAIIYELLVKRIMYSSNSPKGFLSTARQNR
jgi:hypothetical protein